MHVEQAGMAKRHFSGVSGWTSSTCVDCRTGIVFSRAWAGVTPSVFMLLCVLPPIIPVIYVARLVFLIVFSFLMISVHFPLVPRLLPVHQHPPIMSLYSFVVHQAWLPPEHLTGSLPALPGAGRVSQDVATGEQSCHWEIALGDGFFRSGCSAEAARQH